MGMLESNPDEMPALQCPLGTDKDGAAFTEQWNYSSVVGLLMYLVANSQPEIPYAMHQCA